jgi:hypothetical protein
MPESNKTEKRLSQKYAIGRKDAGIKKARGCLDFAFETAS